MKNKLIDDIEGYKETLKSELLNAIENQQDEDSEYYKGMEDALKYALEMLDKHFVILK